MKNLQYLPKRLQDWVSDNNEKITKVDKVWGKLSYRIETSQHVYYWDFSKKELFLENKDDFERVLYPNRAVETRLEGM